MVLITKRLVLFHIVFWGFHCLLFVFGFIKQMTDNELRILNSLGDSVLVSRSSAFVLAWDCGVLLLGVCRNIITALRQTGLNRWIPFEDHIYFHKWTAYSMLLFTILHTNAHYSNMFLVQYQAPQTKLGKAFEIHYQQWAGITGHIMVVIMFLIYTSAKRQVRQKNYEFFWYTHHLFIPFYIIFFLHAKGCFVKSADTKECKGYNSALWATPGFVFVILERLYRHYRASKPTRLTSITFHPGNTMELRFVKPGFSFKPGQYLFLNIPSISKLQWHPFTISSAPEEEFISVHIRIVGDWTKQAASLFALKNTLPTPYKSSASMPTILIDGPYGAPAQDLYNYKVAMLIAGGIGVTPAASLLKSIWYRYKRKEKIPLRKLYFFWINRESEAFSWFKSLLAELERCFLSSELEIHTYLTGNLPKDYIKSIFINDRNSIDPVTDLKSKTHYGRPNWKTVFADVYKQLDRNPAVTNFDGMPLQVGVFVCGNKLMAKAVAEQCLENSHKTIQFLCKKEVF